jgi:hypothetical protein
MQTPIDNSDIFTDVSRSSTFPLVLIGVHRKDAAARLRAKLSVGYLRAGAFVTRKWVSKMASLGPLPAVYNIELPAKSPRASFPPVHGGGHTTNAVKSLQSMVH